jgi:hypothetical protein
MTRRMKGGILCCWCEHIDFFPSPGRASKKRWLVLCARARLLCLCRRECRGDFATKGYHAILYQATATYTLSIAASSCHDEVTEAATNSEHAVVALTPVMFAMRQSPDAPLPLHRLARGNTEIVAMTFAPWPESL